MTSRSLVTLLVLGLASTGLVRAFPPAPDDTLDGMVRDQGGQPMEVTGALQLKGGEAVGLMQMRCSGSCLAIAEFEFCPRVAS